MVHLITARLLRFFLIYTIFVETTSSRVTRVRIHAAEMPAPIGPIGSYRRVECNLSISSSLDA